MDLSMILGSLSPTSFRSTTGNGWRTVKKKSYRCWLGKTALFVGKLTEKVPLGFHLCQSPDKTLFRRGCEGENKNFFRRTG